MDHRAAIENLRATILRDLAALGAVALPQLREARKHEDLEIRCRAQKTLDVIESQKVGGGGGVDGLWEVKRLSEVAGKGPP